jgi:hypothetical protein
VEISEKINCSPVKVGRFETLTPEIRINRSFDMGICFFKDMNILETKHKK